MIDPMISLAFSMYSNKGTYALLLGSGVSRGSGIPTGWEVVIDLLRKVAKLEGEDCEPDPIAWFKQIHAVDPDYSRLLDTIAKTPSERQQLLRAYFEPTNDERAQGQKCPCSAHKAIAQLVSAGYVRVIITTNFDRLLEKALEDAGVSPTVITTTDQVAGAVPLAHSRVTLVKLHGDYLDTRIRNTEGELTAYDTPLSELLDRVIDEYGLVVCGWSAEWDVALRSALERCPSRRFTTYWATRSPLTDKADRLVKHRKGEVIRIQDASHFFGDLFQKVCSLEELTTPHPLSAKMAAAEVKRYLVDPTSRIRLRDLVVCETERTVAELVKPVFSADTQSPPSVEINKRVALYQEICGTLLSVMVTGCFWGERTHGKVWSECLERVADSVMSDSGLVHLLNLRWYPALLLSHAGGIASLAAGNYHNFALVISGAKAKNEEGTKKEYCAAVHLYRAMDDQSGKLLSGMDKRRTPVSDHLHGVLRPALREYLPADDDYDAMFDRFEYLVALVHAHATQLEGRTGSWWGPCGRFLWRRSYARNANIPDIIDAEIKTEGAKWGPLAAGLFGGSLEQAQTAKTKFDTFMKTIPVY